MTTKQKISFLDHFFELVKKEYFSKKELREKENQEEKILSKLKTL